MFNSIVSVVLISAGVYLAESFIASRNIFKSLQRHHTKPSVDAVSEVIKKKEEPSSEGEIFNSSVDFICDCGVHLHHKMDSTSQPDTLCACPACGKSYLLTVNEDLDFDDMTGEINCMGYSATYYCVDNETAVTMLTNQSIMNSHFTLE